MNMCFTCLLILGATIDAADFDSKRIISYANFFRYKHGANSLTYNEQISKSTSQVLAEKVAEAGAVQHITNSTGCNIAVFSRRNLKVNMFENTLIILDAIDLWYDEINLYDWESPGFSYVTGYFTQLVWVSTHKIGIGFAVNPKLGRAVVVANFDPPGNNKFEFKKNVIHFSNLSQPLILNVVPSPSMLPLPVSAIKLPIAPIELHQLPPPPSPSNLKTPPATPWIVAEPHAPYSCSILTTMIPNTFLFCIATLAITVFPILF